MERWRDALTRNRMMETKHAYGRPHPPETVALVVADFKLGHSIEGIARRRHVPASTVRLMLVREKAHTLPEQSTSPRARINRIATPEQWLDRLQQIRDPGIRDWVGSIMWWDLDDARFWPYAENYRIETGDRGNGPLMEALRQIGYPYPEDRILGQQK